MFLAWDNVHLFTRCFTSNFILYFSGNSHEGDMGNLRQSNAGVIDAELTLPLMTLAGDLGIVGRAIVVSKPISFVLPGYKTVLRMIWITNDVTLAGMFWYNLSKRKSCSASGYRVLIRRERQFIFRVNREPIFHDFANFARNIPAANQLNNLKTPRKSRNIKTCTILSIFSPCIYTVY